MPMSACLMMWLKVNWLNGTSASVPGALTEEEVEQAQ